MHLLVYCLANTRLLTGQAMALTNEDNIKLDRNSRNISLSHWIPSHIKEKIKLGIDRDLTSYLYDDRNSQV